MSTEEGSPKIARRRILKLFGLGAAGTAVGAVAASNRIFAKQFVDDGLDIKLPKMTYDPQLQMMVDPQTREPSPRAVGIVRRRTTPARKQPPR